MPEAMPSFRDSAVDADMAADWAAIREKHAVEDEKPDPVAEEPAAEPEPKEAEAPKDDRPRDASGKFVKAEKEPEKVEPKPVEEPAKEPAKVEAEPAPEPAAGQRDVNRPPSSWKPGARTEWDKIPPSVRAEIHRRESDFLNGQHQLLPDAKFGASIRQMAEPYKALIESQGGSPEVAFGSYLRTAATFAMGSHDQKLAAIQAIARQHNIDIRQLFQQQDGQPVQQPQEFRDPRVDQLLQQQQMQEQARQRAEETERYSIAERWVNESDAAGNPLRPYVGDVMNELSALVPQIRQANPSLSHAEVLQQAYDRATWAHPEIRAILQQQQITESEQKRRAENQQRVTEARKSASVNVPRRGSSPAPAKPGTIDQTIAETARALGLVSN